MSESIEFISQLKNRDSAAFDTLVESYQNMVFNTVLSIVQHEHDAEDLTQEVFIQIFKSIINFRGDSKLSTWIYRIAITKSLEWERKKKSQKAINYFKNLIGISAIESELPNFNHPGIALQNKERAETLFKAIKKLPENQRIVFLLIKAEGLGYDEVAEITKKTNKSIEGLMLRAKENLKKILNDYYSE